MSKTYLQQPVAERDLVRLAREEEDAFLVRNAHLVASYQDRLIAVALCQGAALQFIGRGCGVADFDVHFFYCQNPDKQRLSRTVKRVTADVGRFDQVPVDFVRTVVPAQFCPSSLMVEPEDILRAFLKQQPTNNAHHLAQKAVVALLPDVLFGRVIWG